MNVGGYGDDVFPWTSKFERYRFDVSKLAQWEIVFEHMERLGLNLHVVTQEQENDQLLDNGFIGATETLLPGARGPLRPSSWVDVELGLREHEQRPSAIELRELHQCARPLFASHRGPHVSRRS